MYGPPSFLTKARARQDEARPGESGQAEARLLKAWQDEVAGDPLAPIFPPPGWDPDHDPDG
ncbi:hypothetical protein ACIBKY_04715 [Nonomuraea sp. NPDC050394]|uniref:hypothetical protein n=1 Tax=Nonomuraea sp. NPDC050394 TaxID=3364363 RepID=UPI0037949EDC